MKLVRNAYHHTCTLGALEVGDQYLFTMERPWIKHTYPGGTPFKSCIPDGTYSVEPFTRANGDEVIALVNHSLGVYLRADDRPNEQGRYEILLHSANWADQLAGCIAPGLHYKIDNLGRHMVTNSRAAMGKLMDIYEDTLTISTFKGAID